MRRSPDAPKFRNYDWIELSALTDNYSKLYPARESAIAEKFEALVALDVLNTRIKDFYDIWSLSKGMEFQDAVLARAIAATFARRATPLPQQTPGGLTEEFSEDPTKQALWRVFVRKGRLDVESKTLGQVVIELGAFLMPVSDPALESLSEKGGAKLALILRKAGILK